MGWDRSVMGGQWSGLRGSVPDVRPAAYRSIRPGPACPPEPAMRNAASRKERAKPSRPSDQGPEWLGGPGSRYWARPREA